MYLKALLVVIMALALPGCAANKKNVINPQVEQLQMQVSELEKEVQAKDDQIRALEERAGKASLSAEKTGDAYKKTDKNIQIALKNAGFYTGEIDGKIGPNTKKAIREFQGANGLAADGVVGKRTWAKLKTYLK